ncbi:MAG: dihydrofolate reductase [Candidatus Cloacimonetes bacterium]|nr:dihydrofolate reductase [Candidatus Cloacimonadota bacterium]
MNELKISIVAAVAKNRVIGLANRIPWSLPEDLKHFKNLTWGNIVVMGRKTIESIGKPLPGRVNILFSRKQTDEDVYRVADIDEFFLLIDQKMNSGEWQEKEIFIIGGETLFELFLPYAQKLYLTRINEDFAGDTYFPLYDEDEWLLISSEKGKRDEDNPFDYDFMTYQKRTTV